MTSYTLRFNFNYLLEQLIIGGRDRGEVFKFDYPENEKSFLDETRPKSEGNNFWFNFYRLHL